MGFLFRKIENADEQKGERLSTQIACSDDGSTTDKAIEARALGFAGELLTHSELVSQSEEYESRFTKLDIIKAYSPELRRGAVEKYCKGLSQDEPTF